MMKSQQRLPFPEGEDVGKGRALPHSGQLSFDLGAGAPAPASAPPAISPTHAMMPSRGFDQGGAIGHGYPYKGGGINPTSDDWAAAGPSTSKAEHTAGAPAAAHPGQFQMFMTPREIRSKYQGLDADRMEVYDERMGEPTGRPETTIGDANIVANTALRNRWAQWHGGASQVEGMKYARSEGYENENDDQLFARKLEESQMDPAEYREVHGGGTPKEPPGWDTLARRSSAPSEVGRQAAGQYSARTGQSTGSWEEANDEAQDYVMRKGEEFQEEQDYGPSLHDRIREEGVQKPVHLSYDQMGDFGKPEIVGGHHRLAAQHDIDPDQPIPVTHWKSIWEAKQSATYS
jgi:hypothetical protein